MTEEKPNYKLRLSDFKPWIGLDDYIIRNYNEDEKPRVSGREYLLSAYNLVLIGTLLATGWTALRGLDSLFN